MRKRELVQDLGGAGKFDGRLGQEMILQVRTRKPAVHSPIYDRLKFPAKGYAGGQDGRYGNFLLDHGTHPHPKTKYMLRPDQAAILCLPGGDGFSPPCERDPELVRQDMLNGCVPAEAARAEYGVWIEAGLCTIDWAKTVELRKP